MNRREIIARSVLTKTGIPGFDYCINPFVGCEHGCTYCYASFMRRFTCHKEPWGEFLDIKVNAPDVLRKQLKRIKEGTVLVGTVTDPYQPAEDKYQITKGCLETLKDTGLQVNILTRSPLCLRDMDLFREFQEIEVGITLSTDSEKMRRLFEPSAPPVQARIEALKDLHSAGIRTYAFIGPMLPLDPVHLIEELSGFVDEVLIDRLNYSGKVKALYRRESLERFYEGDYFTATASQLREGFQREGIPVSVLFEL